MTNEKLDEAKRLHRESVEKFKTAHEGAMHELEETESTEERVAIRAEAIGIEREAIEEVAHANELLRETIDESKE